MHRPWTSYISKYWRLVVLVIAPFALLPFLIVSPSSESRCAYGVLLMAIYWMTEALPLAVTALLPLVLFPLFGIMSTAEVSIQYLTDTNMMFLGGLMVAISVEQSNLHMRMALWVVLLVGTSPRWIMLGFMLTTSFLSMWINNTATTAMMVPIIEAVVLQLAGYNKEESPPNINTESPEPKLERDVNASHDNLFNSQIALVSSKQSIDVEMSSIGKQEAEASEEDIKPLNPKEFKRLRTGLYLATAYACNIGGTGALNGSAPNLILKGMMDRTFGNDHGLNFATWTMFNFPTMLVCVILAWFWLQAIYVRPLCGSRDSDRRRNANVRDLIRQKYEGLGPITFHELEVLVLFIILILLWLFRDPKFIEGWASFFPKKKVTDSTVVMAVAVIMFALPAKLPGFGRRMLNDDTSSRPPQTALTWKVVQEKLPWNVIILIGGGFAMAEAAKVSGLSAWVGLEMAAFKVLSPVVLVIVISTMTAMLTEVASNTATATIFLPVLANMSKVIRVHPLYTMLPASVACSYAFMLPIATPPNAIVFNSAGMTNSDMMLPGFVMNLLCVGVVTLMINTLGVHMFDLNTFPSWAEDGSSNMTTTMATGLVTLVQNITSGSL